MPVTPTRSVLWIALALACLGLAAACGRGPDRQAGAEAPAAARDTAPERDGEAGGESAELPVQIAAEHPVPSPGTPAALRAAAGVSFLDGAAADEPDLAPELHLAVADLAASAAFYRDVLGFAVEAAVPAEPPHRRMELVRDGLHLVLRDADDLAAELPPRASRPADEPTADEDAGAAADAEEAGLDDPPAPRAPVPAPSPAALHVAATDLDALLRRVEEAGSGTAHLGETSDGSRRLAVRDPDGHVLVFVELLPPAPD